MNKPIKYNQGEDTGIELLRKRYICCYGVCDYCGWKGQTFVPFHFWVHENGFPTIRQQVNIRKVAILFFRTLHAEQEKDCAGIFRINNQTLLRN